MAGKFAIIVVLLCVSQLAFGEDLAKEKEKALTKIKTHSKEVRDAFVKTSDFYNKRVVYLDVIQQQKIELGQSLRELNAFELNKIAEGGKQKWQLLSSPSKVLDCIDAKKQKAISSAETAFDKGFAKPVEDLRGKARNIEQHLAQKWYGDYYAALEVFHVQEDRTTSEIKATNNKAYLEAIMGHFEKIANETVTQILSLQVSFAKNEVQFERTLEKGPMNSFRIKSRKIVDDLVEAVSNCFLII